MNKVHSVSTVLNTDKCLTITKLLDHFICDWILENWPNCHTRPIPFNCPANGYTCTLHIHSAITRLGWLVCFSRVSFANPVNSWLRQWDPWRVLHGSHGSEIHPSDRETSFRPFKHVWGLWLALLGLIASSNSVNRGFNPPPASQLPPLLTPPLLPAHPL